VVARRKCTLVVGTQPTDPGASHLGPHLEAVLTDMRARVNAQVHVLTRIIIQYQLASVKHCNTGVGEEAGTGAGA